jgi:hypothetical protein
MKNIPFKSISTTLMMTIEKMEMNLRGNTLVSLGRNLNPGGRKYENFLRSSRNASFMSISSIPRFSSTRFAICATVRASSRLFEKKGRKTIE